MKRDPRTLLSVLAFQVARFAGVYGGARDPVLIVTAIGTLDRRDTLEPRSGA